MQRMRAIFSQVPKTLWARRGKVGPTILSMHVERRHALKGQNKNEKPYLVRSFAAVRRWRRPADTRSIRHWSWQTCLELADFRLSNESSYSVKRSSLFSDWRKVLTAIDSLTSSSCVSHSPPKQNWQTPADRKYLSRKIFWRPCADVRFSNSLVLF